MKKEKKDQKKESVQDLRPSDYNPRQISDSQLLMLKNSLEEFGDLSGIVVNRKTGNIVGGHQRIKVLDPSWPIFKEEFTDKTGTVALGWIETPKGRLIYREVHWPEKKEKMANLAANKHGGDWDTPKLKDLLKDLNDGINDMNLTGFTGKEIDDLIGKEEEKPEVEFTEELLEEHNYIVLYFDNEIDWLNLQTIFPLKSVKALSFRSGYEKVGIGRVVRGVDFISKVRGKNEDHD